MRFHLVPLPAVEALFGMLHSRIIMASVRLGVFDVLSGGESTAAEIAKAGQLDVEGTRLLCNALAAAGYLRVNGHGHYGLTAMARRYLVADSPHYVGHYVKYNYDQWHWVEHLEEVIKAGRSLDMHQRLSAEAVEGAFGDWRRYLEGLADLARVAAGEITRKVPLPAREGTKARRLLDIGGGDGTFSIAMCARHPDLEAVIIDLPGGAQAGQALVDERAPVGVRARIRFREADALRDRLGEPGSYDVVIMFQLLHHLPPESVPGLLRRAVEMLRPGGWVSVIDLLEPESARRTDAATAYTSLYFHLTSQGRGFTAADIEEWLRAAGCREVRRRPLLRVPGQPLIVGRR
jgi:SAM-dependent methyltransferase